MPAVEDASQGNRARTAATPSMRTMRCEQCGDPLHEEDQKFCTSCGAPVEDATSPDDGPAGDEADGDEADGDEADDEADGDESGGDGMVERDADDDDPVDDEANGDGPLVIRVIDAPDTAEDAEAAPVPSPGTSPEPSPATGLPTPEVPTPPGTGTDAPPAITPTLPRPVLYDLADDVRAAPDGADATLPFHLARPRLGVTVVIGAITGVLGLVAMFPRVLTIRTTSTSPAFSTGDWLLADLGGNLPGAMVVALIFLLAGLIGAAYGQRWGFGLVGGCGLAIAGWSALVLGLAERPVRSALDAAARPSFESFTVTVTRDLGYALVAAAGIAGLLSFVTSAGRAGPDRRRSLNPWIAALGAVAALIAAAGPLLPEGVASIDANWSAAPGAPSALLVGRLAQLGLLAFSGVVGFLLVRRYGLGLAVGGMTVSVWLVVSALTGLGDDPIGPGYNNPGGDLFGVDLHAVTVAGSAALVLLAVAAIIAAYDLAAREP